MRDLLESSDNSVWACSACNREKHDRDVFEWYGKNRLDHMPKLVLSEFLKLAYRLHETQGTLQMPAPNMDGVLDIYELGVVATHVIAKLSAEPGRVKGGVEAERKEVGRKRVGRGRHQGRRSSARLGIASLVWILPRHSCGDALDNKLVVGLMSLQSTPT